MAITLATLKREIKPGTMITLLWHRHASTWRMLGAAAGDQDAIDERRKLTSGEGLTRRVIRCQTNAITFLSGEGSKARESWLYWPKAKDVRGVDGWTFEIWEEGQPLMRYRIEQPNAAAAGGV